jgi:hypothetical protein
LGRTVIFAFLDASKMNERSHASFVVNEDKEGKRSAFPPWSIPLRRVAIFTRQSHCPPDCSRATQRDAEGDYMAHLYAKFPAVSQAPAMEGIAVSLFRSAAA